MLKVESLVEFIVSSLLCVVWQINLIWLLGFANEILTKALIGRQMASLALTKPHKHKPLA